VTQNIFIGIDSSNFIGYPVPGKRKRASGPHQFFKGGIALAMPRILSLSASTFVLLMLTASSNPFFWSTDPMALIPEGSTSFLEAAVDNDLMIWGDMDTDSFGTSVASGDLDGDGYDDIAIGVPDSDYGRRSGSVLLYFARDREELEPAYGFRNADAVIEGINSGDRFGTAVEIEDLDGDGRSELVASAPYADGPGNGRRDTGDVYFVQGMNREGYGHVEGIENLSAWGVVYGKDAGDHLGVRMAFGDLDDNGTIDLILCGEGSGGTADCRPQTQGSPTAENGIIGSWEIDVVLREAKPLGTRDFHQKNSSVRWYGADVRLGNPTPLHIGNGIVAGDFDGDGIDDLLFSYYLDINGYITMSKGGKGFPYIPQSYLDDEDTSYVFPYPGQASTNPHPMFYPNLTIDLGPAGYQEAILCMGDADGDGMKDVLAGMSDAPGKDYFRYRAGQVDLFLGGPITSDTIDRSSAVWTFYGTDAGDRMGSSIAMIDRDSDGLDEIFVGSPYSDGVNNERDGAGELFGFYFGGAFPRTSMEIDADLMLQGKAGYGSASDIASSDMDDNGYPELIVSSPGASSPVGTGKGLVALTGFDGSFEAIFSTPENVSGYGNTVRTGDFDGDGFEDLLIASKYDFSGAGPTDIYFGSGTPWSGRYFDAQSKDLTLYRDYCLGVADLDDDGYDDIIASIRGQGASGNPGNVYIYWGGTRSAMAQLTNTNIVGYENAEFGWAMAAGDIDGDGTDDLAISAHLANGGSSSDRFKSGKVHIWYGPLSHSGISASSADVIIDGALTRDQIGDSLLISDFNGDGFGDLAIGSIIASPGSITNQGSVTIVKGSASLPSRIDLSSYSVMRIDGEWAYDNLGSSMGSEDVIGDARPDLIVTAVGNDGFEKRVSNSGALYVLGGSYISTMMDGGVKQLRKGANLTIYGSQEGEMFGAGLCLSDTDGDARSEIAIGSPKWVHMDTGQKRGAVSFVLGPETMSGKVVNSSDLPKLLGPSESDFGMSIASSFVNADPKADLIIGAPIYDPDQDGTPQGGAFLWLSKSLLPRSIKAKPLEYLNPDLDPLEDGAMGRTPILSPKEGPYMLRVAAVTEFGVPTVTELGVRIITAGGYETTLSYIASNGSFLQTSDTPLKGKLQVQAALCKVWDDGGINIRADFAVISSWDMPDPVMIVTYVRTTSGDNMNYRTSLFQVDRSLSVADHVLVVRDVDGGPALKWLNETTVFEVKNVTLVHGRTGKTLSGAALDSLQFSLRRPDGFKIGTGVRSGTMLKFGPTTVGKNITGSDLPFTITLDSDILGLLWIDEPVLIDADTYAPPAIGTFKVVNDGQEGGYDPIDDDPYIEVLWSNVLDTGDSGIANYRFHIISQALDTHITLDDVSPHDLILIPQGPVVLGLQAIDNARNEGPIRYIDILSDMSEPVFFAEDPLENSWLKDGSMTVRVMVEDNASGLDVGSAQVRYYIAQTGFLSTWITPAALTEPDGSLTLSYDMPRIEGILNYVQWSIADLSGRVSVSRPYYYNVDLTLPRIEEHPEIDWITGGPINLTTVIIDTLSGLDLSSVSYKFGPQSGFFTQPYVPLGYKGFGAAAYPTVTVDPDFSGWAYLQWKAMDRAGNAAESSIIVYYVDERMPILDGILPSSDTVVGSREVTVTVRAVDPESGIMFDGMEYSMSNTTIWVEYGIGGYTPWAKMDRITDTGGGFYEGTVNLTFDQGDFNFIKVRLMDRAGNGWVESSPHRIRVTTYQPNMPPVALFEVIPFVDEIYQGETLKLDGSSSYDPENRPLTFRWYSDIETYPATSLLGNRSVVEISLNTTGVQRLWLEVSDGKISVRSQDVRIHVLPLKTVPGNEDGSSGSDLSDYLPYIVLALFIGIVIGLAVSLFLRRRREEKPLLPPPVLEDARMEVDYHQSKCPYCKAEVRTTDTYCIKCGTVFTAEDIENMRSIGAERPGRKKTRLELQQPSEDSILPPSLEGDPIFLEGAVGSEDMIAPEEEIEEFEDIEEMEDVDEDEDWEVRP
jgi:hypothetical protein